MAANPALVQTFNNELVPAPFASELFVLKRPKVGFELDGVQTRNGKLVGANELLQPSPAIVHACGRLTQLLASAARHALHLRWSTTGALYLSNVRVVFVADKADPSGATEDQFCQCMEQSEQHRRVKQLGSWVMQHVLPTGQLTMYEKTLASAYCLV